MSASALIVSEHADIAELIADQAKSLKKFAQVESCPPGAAVNQLKESSPDLLILDMAEGDEDYVDLVTEFQTRRPRAWVVLMTELWRAIPVPMRAENIVRVERNNFASLSQVLAILAA